MADGSSASEIPPQIGGAALNYLSPQKRAEVAERHAANLSQVEPDRLDRLQRQVQLEENLSSLYELPFAERVLAIRHGLYPNSEKATQERTEPLISDGEHAFDNTAFVTEHTEELGTLIDTIIGNWNTIPESDRAVAATRLASALYTIGIVIHRYNDGNGQTAKLLLESYMHQLGNDSRYFPLRLHNAKGSGEGNLESSLTNKVAHLDPLLGALPDEGRARIMAYYGIMLMRTAAQRDLDQAIEKDPDYKELIVARKEEVDRLEEELTEQFPDREEQQKVVDQFTNQERQVQWQNDYERNTFHFLQYLLTTSQGKNLIQSYVAHGGRSALREETLLYGREAVNTFESIREEMGKLLESRETHVARFEEVIHQ